MPGDHFPRPDRRRDRRHLDRRRDTQVEAVMNPPWWAWLPLGALIGAWMTLNLRDAGQRLRRILPPAPAADPPRVPEQGPAAPPVPGHYSGPAAFGLYGWRCGCMYAHQITTGQWKQVRECGRPDFNVAEWEARLPHG